MTQISSHAQKTLDALRKAVTDALERKRRLGHYAVVCRDGRPVAIGEDAPDELKEGSERFTEKGH